MRLRDGENSSTASRHGLIAAAGFLLFCVSLQWLTGAWHDDFTTYPDEPAHFVGSVMVRQWILSGHWTTPFRFATDFYNHYPFFAVGYWPPLFYVVAAFDMLLLGIGRGQAMLIPAICAAGSAWIIWHLLRTRIGSFPAASAAILWLALPSVNVWYRTVMVDHMTGFLCLASALVLLRWLERPDMRNGILLAVCCGMATLSKYSGAYVVVMPVATIILTRRFSLLRAKSFLVQFGVLALMVGPWVFWTRSLASYGLPDERPAISVARVATFLSATLHIFPALLWIPLIAGLVAMLVLRSRWSMEAGIIVLLLAGHFSLLVISNVGPEPRYMLAPAAALLILSLMGWAAAISLTPMRHPLAAPVFTALMLIGAVLFARGSERPPSYPIRPIVSTVLKQAASSGERVLVPSDLDGPFIAEFVAETHGDNSVELLRPERVLAHSDWFGEHYDFRMQNADEVIGYLNENHIRCVIWHSRDSARQRPHEHLLGEALRLHPEKWQKSGLTPKGDSAWVVYEPVR